MPFLILFDVKKFSKVNSELPEALDKIIWKALQKDKAKRYESMGELVGELELLLEKGR